MIVLSTGTLYTYGIARVFKLAAEAGYDGVEVLIDDRWDSRDADYLKRLSSDSKLPIAAIHSPFLNNIQGWPDDQLNRLKKTVKLAKQLAVPLVVAHLPSRIYAFLGQFHFLKFKQIFLPMPFFRRDSYYSFLGDGRLIEMEKSYGITIAIENMPALKFFGIKINPCWYNSPDELNRFRHLTLDTTHLATWGLDPISVYNRLKHQVAHIHLSNFDGAEHRLPPDGHLKLDKFLNNLSENQYKGVVSVEASPTSIGVNDERICREAIEKTLAFCRENFNP